MNFTSNKDFNFFLQNEVRKSFDTVLGTQVFLANGRHLQFPKFGNVSTKLIMKYENTNLLSLSTYSEVYAGRFRIHGHGFSVSINVYYRQIPNNQNAIDQELKQSQHFFPSWVTVGRVLQRGCRPSVC